MNVTCAKDHIRQIDKLCNQINEFDQNHDELNNETQFFCDVLAFLCDYKRTLEKAIDKAELNL